MATAAKGWNLLNGVIERVSPLRFCLANRTALVVRVAPAGEMSNSFTPKQLKALAALEGPARAKAKVAFRAQNTPAAKAASADEVYSNPRLGRASGLADAYSRLVANPRSAPLTVGPGDGVRRAIARRGSTLWNFTNGNARDCLAILCPTQRALFVLRRDPAAVEGASEFGFVLDSHYDLTSHLDVADYADIRVIAGHLAGGNESLAGGGNAVTGRPIFGRLAQSPVPNTFTQSWLMDALSSVKVGSTLDVLGDFMIPTSRTLQPDPLFAFGKSDRDNITWTYRHPGVNRGDGFGGLPSGAVAQGGSLLTLREFRVAGHDTQAVVDLLRTLHTGPVSIDASLQLTCATATIRSLWVDVTRQLTDGSTVTKTYVQGISGVAAGDCSLSFHIEDEHPGTIVEISVINKCGENVTLAAVEQPGVSITFIGGASNLSNSLVCAVFGASANQVIGGSATVVTDSAPSSSKILENKGELALLSDTEAQHALISMDAASAPAEAADLSGFFRSAANFGKRTLKHYVDGSDPVRAALQSL